jgi:molybdopterin molybdotransferase
MGDYDLVPSILKQLGVKEIFHKVNIKPGKPLFFGKRGRTVIFAVAGNPVSNFVSYFIFIRPAIYKMSGYTFYGPKFTEGILEEEFYHRPGRKHFVLIKTARKNHCWHIKILPTHGSADISSLSKADGFMVVDADVSYIKAKSKVRFFTWKEERLII